MLRQASANGTNFNGACPERSRRDGLGRRVRKPNASIQWYGAGSTTYTLDGDGRRVKKSSGTLYWYGAGGSVLAETDSNGNTTNEYIFFGGRIARRDSAGNVYYYFGDQIGSSRMIAVGNGVNAGALCFDADFYPFGGQRPAYVDTCSQNYKFAGMERDPETGNDHTQFRQYASNLGRWLSPDPMGGDVTNPQSLNRYAYVMNNPTTLTDPSGMGPQAGTDASWFCPPESGQCQMLPGSYDPYSANGPGGAAISTGSMFPKMNSDFAAGEAAYAAHVNAVFDMRYLTSMAEEYGGIPADQVTAYLSTHPELKLNYGLLWEEQSLSIFSGSLLDQRSQIYGYSVVENPLQLAGMEAEGPVIDMEIAAPFVVAAPYAIGEFATSAAGDALFARGVGLLNSNDYVRIGWAWYRYSLLDYPYGGFLYFGIRIGTSHVWGP
jgi:RHS repeat-associated protein